MVAPASIDSNASGLRIAEEATPGVLPGTPIWYPREPNGYSDFGGSISRVSRNPISATRQRKKGVASGVDASGGYGEDFTETNFMRLLQGFLVADAREKATTQSITGTAAIAFTSTTNATKTLAAAAGLDIFKPGDIVLISGFGESATNGVKEIATAAAGAITTVEAIGADEGAPPSSAKVEVVGYRAATPEFAVDAAGDLPKVTAATVDLTTLGIVPGEWLYFPPSAGGGFATAANSGYARVKSISVAEIVLDKTSTTWVTEASPGTSVEFYLGTVFKNENDENLIKRRTYQLERTLGNDGDGVQSQYVTGAFPNELSMSVPTEDKITADLTFVGLDVESRTGLDGVKSGTRPALVSEDAYNTSNNFSRIRLAPLDAADSNPSPLFAYGTEFTFSVKNNVSPNKAVSVFGAFSTNLGIFEVDGSAEVYFSTLAAVAAIRNNTDITIDMIFGKNNSAWAIDLPLLALGDGRPNIEPNQPIKLPLELEAAESSFNHTMLFVRWPYLPASAIAA